MLPLRNSLRTKILPAVLLLIVVVLAALSLFLRSRYSNRLKAPYRLWAGPRNSPVSTRRTRQISAFVVDPDFGFRPILGSGNYTCFGTLANDYSETKRPGVVRLLFIGDSVTRRGQIVEALRAQYGSQHYEYWNAGVESFNTVRGGGVYKRFNRPIQPDHVILTFHLNDFETTPVAFREADGTLVVYAPNWPIQRLNPWLFRHSYTYRYWLGLLSPRKAARSEIIEQVRDNLADLSRGIARDNARLTVLVLPILRPLTTGSLSTENTGV